MADRLTQLQDCLDDLLTQMFSSLYYIQTRHPYGNIPDQPSQAPEAQSINQTLTSAVPASATSMQANGPQVALPDESRPSTPPPDDPETFQRNLRELAQDLVNKEHQIEYLINSLPGIGNSEADQERRMRELEAELKEVETERKKAEVEKERLVEALGRVIVGVKRVGG